MSERQYIPGDVATYRYATEDELQARKQELAANILHPRLSFSQRFVNVVMPTLTATVSVFVSGWFALDSLIHQSAFAQRIANWIGEQYVRFGKERHVFTPNAKEIYADIQDIVKHFWGVVPSHDLPNGRQPNALGTARRIRAMAEKGFRSGLEEFLDPFISALEEKYAGTEFASGYGIPPSHKEDQEGLLNVLKTIYEKHPNSLVGEYLGFLLNSTNPETAVFNASKAKETFIETLEKDNRLVIDRARIPIMAAASVITIGAILFSRDKEARENKKIRYTVEDGFIDRLERERHKPHDTSSPADTLMKSVLQGDPGQATSLR